MKAELIIEHGQVKFVQPIYLKPTAHSRLTVEIDEEDIMPSRDWFPAPQDTPKGKPAQPAAADSPMQAIFNEILGSQAIERPGTSIGDDHQLLMDALEDRYFGR